MECLIAALCEGLVVGLHLLSLHTAASYTTETNNVGDERASASYRTLTPGVYLRTQAGFTAGAYHNSIGKPSFYAGWSFATDDDRFALTLGAVTGYRRTVHRRWGTYVDRHETAQVGSTVQPLVVPSVKVDLTDAWAARLSYVPRPDKGETSVFHLSIEHRF